MNNCYKINKQNKIYKQNRIYKHRNYINKIIKK